MWAAAFIGPFRANALRTQNRTPRSSGYRHNVDSYLEMHSENEIEEEIESLRVLICDLLRTNQQLRVALVAAIAKPELMYPETTSGHSTRPTGSGE